MPLKKLLAKMYNPIMSLKVSEIEPFMRPATPTAVSNEVTSKDSLPSAKRRKVTPKVTVEDDD